MPTYRLLTPAFVAGVYHRAGAVIATEVPPGKDWVAVDADPTPAPEPHPTPRPKKGG